MLSTLRRASAARSRRAAALLVAAAASLSGCVDGGTGFGLNLVSQEQLADMGRQSWEQITQETPSSRDATLNAAARNVSARILSAAGQNPQQWEVRVFASPDANAFALPGNKIGVYEGLFRFAKNEDQLAAVIGHEVGHNLRQHAAERVSTQLATEAGTQILSSALALGGMGGAQEISALLGAGAQYGLILPYSRNQELDADRVGLELMARAGYDPRQAVELWRNMAQSGERQPEFVSTHPGPENRIRQLEALMPEALAIYRSSR
ncbi:M48 family metallopeptidase [Arenibaculum pallidiluteum]|uniref:M48 family metallopeptidase n=1 Tax=Arenibaculum pallidiluteum TaxID=2812559 RepID=UPI001A9789AE|nr:M48 family metallopeptidase [Arenibaculum pallidiluteum]